MAVCAGRVGQGRLGGLPPGGNSAPVPRFPDEPIWSSKSSAAIGGAAGREGYAPWTAIPGPVRGVQSVSLRAEAFLPLILFLVTCFTTLVAGTLQRGISPGAMWANPVLLYEGLPFAGTLMLILGAHELGHYFTSRRWGVNASLPYFIPAPSLLGTFGAVIRIRSVIRNRKALMDIAVAGPLAGMAAALPAAVAGLYLSRIVELDPGAGGSGFGLGTSWLFDALTWLVIGSRADEAVIVLHPAAFAGWCGFFVTSLNLIPAGQLDGGHIIYSLFGRWHRRISIGAGLALLVMAYWWQGWLIWAIIALVLGRRHPPLVDEWEPLGKTRTALGYGCILLMLLTFISTPLVFD